MNKFTILFLTLLLALPVAMKAESAKEKRDDTRIEFWQGRPNPVYMTASYIHYN